MNNNEVIVIDTETTSKFKEKALIVEIAAIKLDCNSFKYQILYNSLCNPNLTKEMLEQTWICQNGYIKSEEILKAKPDSIIAKELRSALHNYQWTTFNLEYDGAILARNPWNIRKNKSKCIMKAAKPVCGIPHHYYGIKFPSLNEANKKLLNRSQPETHRALTDATIATEVLIYLIKNGHYKCK